MEDKRQQKQPAKARKLWRAAGVKGCWVTRIRTGNDRTKTCSVTVTPSPNPICYDAPRGILRLQSYE